MPDYLDGKRSLDAYWRTVILFGRNVASYKFALAKSLMELSTQQKSFVSLEELAVPFSKNIVEHLRIAPKQATSPSSRFLQACQKFSKDEIDQNELIATTTSLGFNNVIDAFHIVNRGEIPVRFYVDERQNTSPGIRLTDELFKLSEGSQFQNLPHETEARWRLVETAWELGLPRGVIVGVEDNGTTAIRRNRRIAITGSRHALNGYQKGKCFYCFSEISVNPKANVLADVDHFFPRILMQQGKGITPSLDGVWNLVLACRNCNRGVLGKSTLLPTMRLLQRLNTRNEFLINSHHPLRETLIAQMGDSPAARNGFLNDVYNEALGPLNGQTWEPELAAEKAF